jgi:uncharacterized protein Veg
MQWRVLVLVMDRKLVMEDGDSELGSRLIITLKNGRKCEKRSNGS